jgi:hypothetical protein
VITGISIHSIKRAHSALQDTPCSLGIQAKVRVVCIAAIVRGMAKALKQRLITAALQDGRHKKKGARPGALFISVEVSSDQFIR